MESVFAGTCSSTVPYTSAMLPVDICKRLPRYYISRIRLVPKSPSREDGLFGVLLCDVLVSI